MAAKYGGVTEIPGAGASKEQLERAYQRYRFAYQFCGGKDVLEVACGAGQGLGYLARTANKVVGGDIEEDNLKWAEKQYAGRDGIELKIFDAQNMPFKDGSFDVVIMYEGIYYLTDASKFIGEAYRVLRSGGSFIVCTANKDWTDFNPSPFSVRYYSVPDLASLLEQKFSDIDIYGGFAVRKSGPKESIISFLKRTAVTLRIMPKTMKGKKLLKRLFFGKLYPMPSEIEEYMTEYVDPVRISSDSSNSSSKIIYAIAKKKGQESC